MLAAKITPSLLPTAYSVRVPLLARVCADAPATCTSRAHPCYRFPASCRISWRMVCADVANTSPARVRAYPARVGLSRGEPLPALDRGLKTDIRTLDRPHGRHKQLPSRRQPLWRCNIARHRVAYVHRCPRSGNRTDIDGSSSRKSGQQFALYSRLLSERLVIS